MRAALCVALTWLACVPALAQEGSEEPPELAPAAEVPPPPPDGAAEWARFTFAAERAIASNSPEGRSELERLAAEDETSPVSQAARALLDALRNSLASPQLPPPLVDPTEPVAPPPPPEHDPTGAIAELAVVHGFFGGGMGLWACLLADCREPALFAGLSLLGVGAGLTLSILLPDRSFQSGQAETIGWGSFWGAGFGGLLVGLLGSTGSSVDGQGIGGTLLLSTAIGTGVGIGLAAGLNPDPGRLSMAGLTGLWFGALSMMSMGIAPDFGLSATGVLSVLTGFSVGGIVVGSVLGEFYPMSRGRVLLVTGIGVLGAGIGMGATVLFANDYVHEAFWTAAMIGSLSGIIITAVLTDELDHELRDPEVQVGLAPLEGGGLLTFSGSL